LQGNIECERAHGQVCGVHPGALRLQQRQRASDGLVAGAASDGGRLLRGQHEEKHAEEETRDAHQPIKRSAGVAVAVLDGRVHHQVVHPAGHSGVHGVSDTQQSYRDARGREVLRRERRRHWLHWSNESEIIFIAIAL